MAKRKLKTYTIEEAKEFYITLEESCLGSRHFIAELLKNTTGNNFDDACKIRDHAQFMVTAEMILRSSPDTLDLIKLKGSSIIPFSDEDVITDRIG